MADHLGTSLVLTIGLTPRQVCEPGRWHNTLGRKWGLQANTLAVVD